MKTEGTNRTFNVQEEELIRLRARVTDLEQVEAARSRAETSLRQATGRLSGVIATQEEIARADLDLNATLNLIVQRAEELTGADGAVIELVEGNDVIYRVDSGSARAHTSGIPQFKALDGLSALSATTGQVIICEDAETDPRVNPEGCRGLSIKSLVAIPVYYQRKVVGVLKIFSPYSHAFGQREVETLQLLEGQIVTALSHSAEFEAKQALLAERTASLAALQESEQRFKSAFVNSAIGMALVTPENRFLQVNPAFCQMLGYTEQELLGKLTADVTDPADLPGDLISSPELLSREELVLDLEKRYLHKSGRVVWVLINASLFRNTEGLPLYFICQVQDITARKLAEESLKQLNSELEKRYQDRTALLQNAMEQAEASRRHFAFLAEATALLVSSLEYRDSLTALIQMSVPYLADYALVELLEDQALFQMTASDLDPHQDHLLYDFRQSTPVDLNDDNPFSEVLRTGKPLLYSEVPVDILEAYAASPEQLGQLQEARLQSILVVPMIGREKVLGAFTFLLARPGRCFSPAEVALAEDLARRAAMAVDNNRLYREAQEAVRVQKELDYLKDLFVSVAGHELRTPLTTIRGFSQMLQRSLVRQAEPLEPQAHREALEKHLHFLDTITRQTNRMNGLIMQLLDFSRMQNGQFELTESGPVNLVELAQRVVEQQNALETDRSISLKTGEGPIIIKGDSDRLEQVLHNLISNACKYSPEGKPVNVEVSIVPPSGENQLTEAIIVVKDQGHGISLEDQPHIFDRFYRARNRETARTGGLGLGLFISHEIVGQHQGRMWLESQPGLGSTFYIALPLASSGQIPVLT